MEDYIVITKDGVDYKYKLVKENNILDLIRRYIEENFVMIQTREYPRKILRRELDEYLIKKLKCTTTDIQWQWVITAILRDKSSYYRKFKIRKIDRRRTLKYFFKNDVDKAVK